MLVDVLLNSILHTGDTQPRYSILIGLVDAPIECEALLKKFLVIAPHKRVTLEDCMKEVAVLCLHSFILSFFLTFFLTVFLTFFLCFIHSIYLSLFHSFLLALSRG